MRPDATMDRAAIRREDPDWFDERLRAPTTRFVAVASGRHPISEDGAGARRPCYLGARDVEGSLERCTEEAVAHKFFLHVFPSDPDDLENPYFNNLDFDFIPGVFRDGLDDGRCVTIRPLPDYAVERIRTGQFFSGEEPLWKGEANLVKDAEP